MQQDRRIIPSCVSFTPEGERLVCKAAKEQLEINPENTITNIKRLIGFEFKDPFEIKLSPFKIVYWNNRPCIQLKTNRGDAHFATEQVTAKFFK